MAVKKLLVRLKYECTVGIFSSYLRTLETISLVPVTLVCACNETPRISVLYLAPAALDERIILREALLHAVVVDHFKNKVLIYN